MSYIFSPLASQTEIITFYIGYCWFTGTCFRELLVKILESLGNFAVLTWTSCGRYSSSSSFKRLSNCWTATLRISWSGKLKQSILTMLLIAYNNAWEISRKQRINSNPNALDNILCSPVNCSQKFFWLDFGNMSLSQIPANFSAYKMWIIGYLRFFKKYMKIFAYYLAMYLSK